MLNTINLMQYKKSQYLILDTPVVPYTLKAAQTLTEVSNKGKCPYSGKCLSTVLDGDEFTITPLHS